MQASNKVLIKIEINNMLEELDLIAKDKGKNIIEG
jgi:hypothetical protein